MNIDTIGYNAGLVWNALNDADALGLKQIKKVTKLKDKELYAALRVSASPFGDAARMALGDTAGAIVSFCAAAGCLGSLGGWTLLAGQTAKAAADADLIISIA